MHRYDCIFASEGACITAHINHVTSRRVTRRGGFIHEGNQAIGRHRGSILSLLRRFRSRRERRLVLLQRGSFCPLNREESFVRSLTSPLVFSLGRKRGWTRSRTLDPNFVGTDTCLPKRSPAVYVCPRARYTHTTHSDFVCDVVITDGRNCHLYCARAVGYEKLVSTGSTCAECCYFLSAPTRRAHVARIECALADPLLRFSVS